MIMKRAYLVRQGSDHGRGIAPFDDVSVKEHKRTQTTHLTKAVCNSRGQRTLACPRERMEPQDVLCSSRVECPFSDELDHCYSGSLETVCSIRSIHICWLQFLQDVYCSGCR